MPSSLPRRASLGVALRWRPPDRRLPNLCNEFRGRVTPVNPPRTCSSYNDSVSSTATALPEVAGRRRASSASRRSASPLFVAVGLLGVDRYAGTTGSTAASRRRSDPAFVTRPGHDARSSTWRARRSAAAASRSYVYLPPGYARAPAPALPGPLPPARLPRAARAPSSRPSAWASSRTSSSRGTASRRRSSSCRSARPGTFTDKEWANGVRPARGLGDVRRARPRRARSTPLPHDPERRGRALAGLSEGGYGALNIGLHHPGEFRRARELVRATSAPTTCARSSAHRAALLAGTARRSTRPPRGADAPPRAHLRLVLLRQRAIRCAPRTRRSPRELARLRDRAPLLRRPRRPQLGALARRTRPRRCSPRRGGSRMRSVAARRRVVAGCVVAALAVAAAATAGSTCSARWRCAGPARSATRCRSTSSRSTRRARRSRLPRRLGRGRASRSGCSPAGARVERLTAALLLALGVGALDLPRRPASRSLVVRQIPPQRRLPTRRPRCGRSTSRRCSRASPARCSGRSAASRGPRAPLVLAVLVGAAGVLGVARRDAAARTAHGLLESSRPERCARSRARSSRRSGSRCSSSRAASRGGSAARGSSRSAARRARRRSTSLHGFERRRARGRARARRARRAPPRLRRAAATRAARRASLAAPRSSLARHLRLRRRRALGQPAGRRPAVHASLRAARDDRRARSA